MQLIVMCSAGSIVAVNSVQNAIRIIQENLNRTAQLTFEVQESSGEDETLPSQTVTIPANTTVLIDGKGTRVDLSGTKFVVEGNAKLYMYNLQLRNGKVA